MRRFSVLIVTLCLVFAMAVTVSAASSVCASDKKTVSAGGEITFSVTLKNSEKVQTLGVTPSFDGDVFELVSGKWTLTDSLIKDFRKQECRGALLFAEEKDCNGEVFVFTLKVRDGAALGETAVKAELILQNGDKQDVVCGTVETTVTVTEKAGQTVTPPDASAVPEDTATPEDTAVYETAADGTDILATAGDSVGAVTSPDGTETEDSGLDMDFIDEGVLVDDPEETGGINKKILIFAGIAIAVCLIIGWCAASNKKRN